MSGSLFHSENLGRTPFYFWYGMVVGGKEWEDNQKDEAISKHKIHERDDVAGWGHRCKVAIMGYDPRITDKGAKNSELVMAEVMVPTTGGGGVGGPVMTPTLGNNSFVVGFYKDGVSAREPVIMGVLPNVSQTRMKPYNQPETTRYDASTGYRPGEDFVANDSLWGDGDKMETGEMVRPYTVMLKAQKDDGDRTFGIPSIERCQKSQGAMEGIQLLIQQMMNGINGIKASSSSFISAASDARRNINSIVATATNLITGFVRDMIGSMRGFVLNLVNKAVQVTIDLLPANLVSPTMDTGINPAIDILTCVFNKLMNQAKGIVGNFLNDLIGGAVNSFFSTAGALVGNFLTNALGGITSAIDSALSAIGSIGNINPVSALDAVFGLLKLFSCEDDQYCPSITQWNFLYGTSKNGFTSSSQTSVSSFYNPTNPTTAAQATEQSFPVLSGPPLINVFGGGQAPATQSDTTPSPTNTSQQSTTQQQVATPSPTNTSQQSTTQQQVGSQADAESQAFVAQEREIARTGSSQSSYDLGDGAKLDLF